MHKLIRPNLIHKVSRSAPPVAPQASYVSFNNIQMLQQKPAVNIAENADATYPFTVCLCTILHNNQKDYETIVSNIRSFQRMFKKSFVVFVESKSTDNTVELFSKLDNALFIRMDATSTEAECRNAYLAFVKRNTSLFDMIVVADVNIAFKNPISRESLECFKKPNKWSALFANQSYRYYDIQSLRTKECPSDLSELDDETRKTRVRTLRRHIPRDEKFISVVSAFGGLAIYKTQYLLACEYANDGHVTFNIRFNAVSKDMFIDPNLVLETLEENVSLYV